MTFFAHCWKISSVWHSIVTHFCAPLLQLDYRASHILLLKERGEHNFLPLKYQSDRSITKALAVGWETVGKISKTADFSIKTRKLGPNFLMLISQPLGHPAPKTHLEFFILPIGLCKVPSKIVLGKIRLDPFVTLSQAISVHNPLGFCFSKLQDISLFFCFL